MKRHRKPLSIPEKLLANSMPEPNSGCWLWTGSVAHTGYGVVYNADTARTEGAHRASYRCFKGELDPALCVCHSCDIPTCINPDHLWLGTAADNVRDKVRKGRAFKKLDAEKVRKIRASAGSQSSIAAEFGVSQATVSDIKQRKFCAHIA